jgi:hypothetical protein
MDPGLFRRRIFHQIYKPNLESQALSRLQEVIDFLLTALVAK